MNTEPYTDMDIAFTQKIDSLQAYLEGMGPTLIAFSGGVDSSFLLAVASQVLRNDVIALMTVSPSTPPHDEQQAIELVKRLKVKLLRIRHNELEISEYAANPVNRCYFCKSSLYEICQREAKRLALDSIADGINLDDLTDYRPGLQSAEEYNVCHPLVEAGLTKADIRQASRLLGLSTWDKPASPCLSSRIPYGTHITATMLSHIAQAEAFLYTLGITQTRVRYDGKSARIEIGSEALEKVASQETLQNIGAKLKSLGIPFVTLDLEGYKSGVFNIGLKAARSPAKPFA